MKKFLVILLTLILAGTLIMMSADKSCCEKSATKCEKDTTKKECKSKQYVCVVSGKPIAEDAQKIKVEYKGKTYYVGCEKCKEAFLKNPEKYTKTCKEEGYYCTKEGCNYKSDKPGKCPKCGTELKKHEYKAVYACPMKSCNFKSDKPGKCPKCGMELKKEAGCKHTEKETHKCTKKEKNKH